MTSKLPVLSGRKCAKILEKIGYEMIRQKGSHMRLKHKFGELAPITVPDHPELRPGLLLKIIKSTGLTIEEFNRLV